MFFARFKDTHDVRAQKILDQIEEDSALRTPDTELLLEGMKINFNLAGIRRRLNNIEIGIWALVVILTIRFWLT